MVCISINDTLIKQLSANYPLHQMVFVRSSIGIVFSLIILQIEGGFAMLRTSQARLHLLRVALVVFANMTFYAALAAIPLADATALFFVAPLFITLLSIPILGERVGRRRLAAVVVGFIGVLVVLRPGLAPLDHAPSRLTLLLPILAYAFMQVMTRRLGVRSTASAMAVSIPREFSFW